MVKISNQIRYLSFLTFDNSLSEIKQFDSMQFHNVEFDLYSPAATFYIVLLNKLTLIINKYLFTLYLSHSPKKSEISPPTPKWSGYVSVWFSFAVRSKNGQTMSQNGNLL